MAKRRSMQPVERHDIEVQHDGQTYQGYYTLQRKMIRVHLLGGGSKTTHSSHFGKNDTLARIMLGELIREDAASKRN